MSTSSDLVTIGKIDRPFGIHGAVKVRSMSDRPGRFEHLRSVCVTDQAGVTVDRAVRHIRRAGTCYIVEFEGVTTPEDAGMFRGSLMQVPREIPSAAESDVWYACDLIGMTVADEAGHEIGCLEAIWEMPAHPVLVVNHGGREVLIPAVKEFVRAVDVAQHRMTVRRIEGLVEV
jgi:16S rRNA processing protein RimM